MTAPVREGEVLARKYRVEKVLGVGGMGVVVSAMHLQLDQRVALKFLLPDALAIPEVVSRFAREARAAARIKSEHVARVIDVGELDSGSPFMVMEFLEGQDLAQVLEVRGPLPASDVAAWILQACEAIAEAHAAGIIHRDLKPSNLFLANTPDKSAIVKVLDFGISKATGPTDGALTSTQALLGSPLYMSPEQMTAPKTIDARSDIWSIGVILYQLLTGHTPFEAETMPELIASILATHPPAPSSLRAGIGPDMDALVTRCLAKDRTDRFANVAELALALAPWAPEERQTVERIARVIGGQPLPSGRLTPASGPNVTAILAPSRGTGAAEPSQGPAVTVAQSAWGGTHVETRSEKKSPLLLLGGVGAAVLVALGVVVAWRTSQSTTREVPAAGMVAASAATPERVTPPRVEQEPSAAMASVPSAAPGAEAGSPVASAPASVSSSSAAPLPKAVAAAKPVPKPAPHPKPEAEPAPAPETNRLKMEIK